MHKTLLIFVPWIITFSICSTLVGQEQMAERLDKGVAITNLDLDGSLNPQGGEFVISGHYQPQKLGDKEDELIYASVFHTELRRDEDLFMQTDTIDIHIIHGTPKRFAFHWQGESTLQSVTGKHLEHWSVHHHADGTRTLNIVPIKDKTLEHMRFVVKTERPIAALPFTFAPTQWIPEFPNPYSGTIHIYGDRRTLQYGKEEGLSLLERVGEPSPAYAFAYANTPYTLQLTQLHDDLILKAPITIDGFQLQGQLFAEHAQFTLKGRAIVNEADVSSIPLLSGSAALTSYPNNDDINIILEDNHYFLKFEKPGVYPFTLEFAAAIKTADGWKTMAFDLLDSPIRTVAITGFAEATAFGASSSFVPKLEQRTVTGSLPIQAPLTLQWKTAGPDVSAELFFSSSSVNRVLVSPGYMKQLSTVDLKLLQGQMETVTLRIEGQGEVTQVKSPHLLKWEQLETATADTQLIHLTFNQRIEQNITLELETQTTLDTFPVNFSPLRITPEATTQHQGYYVFTTQGAVRMETLNQTGLVQVAASNVPVELPKDLQGTLIYRFASAAHTVLMQASDILPEYSVSHVAIYHFEKSSDSIVATIELDIKEAPLREWTLWVPQAYSVAKIEIPSMADYMVLPHNATHQALTLQFSQPLTGRHIATLQLERNQRPLPDKTSLPPLYFPDAKHVRGTLGVTGQLGLRLSPVRLEHLAETPAAYFPEKVEGLQLTYRMRDRNWQADILIEELAHVVQADALNLFSVGDGIAYGSTVINYQISGAPLTHLSLQVPTNYRNVEFSGRNIRSWKADKDQYTVELQSAISGAYALMATYDAPLSRGDNDMSFVGLTPTGVESEQGYVLVISKLPFQVQPVEVSPQLMQLEPQEIPEAYRLLFDAPLLASYQYTQRPFAATLSLKPFKAGMSIDQVVEFAAFDTQVSVEGELLTQARYALKSKGKSHFHLRLPEGVELWEALVDGKPVTPIIAHTSDAPAAAHTTNDAYTLIPLPPEASVNQLIHVELQLASQSERRNKIAIALPQTDASILTSEWRMRPDTGNAIYFIRGSLNPVRAPQLHTGIHWLDTVLTSSHPYYQFQRMLLIAVIGMFILCKVIGYYSSKQDNQGIIKRMAQGLYALLGITMALGLAFLLLNAANDPEHIATDIFFSQPIQQPNAAWEVVIANYAAGTHGSYALLALLMIVGIGVLVGTRWLNQDTSPLLVRGAVTLGWGCIFAFGLYYTGSAALIIVVGIWLLLQLIPLGVLRRLRPATMPVFVAVLCCLSPQPAEAITPEVKEEFYAAEPSSYGSDNYYLQSIVQSVAIAEDQALVEATLSWQAEANALSIPFLYAPAVLVDVTLPDENILVSHTKQGPHARYVLTADRPGMYQVDITYRIAMTSSQSWQTLTLPTSPGLVNQASIHFPRLELEVQTDDAASMVTQAMQGKTVTQVHFQPMFAPTIQWRPRSRDTRAEASVFYAALSSLYTPQAGVVAGVHEVVIQQAQGELQKLLLKIPAEQNVTHVATPLLESWYFNPDNRQLTLHLKHAVQAGFTAHIHTQAAPAALPYSFTCGAIVVDDAASQSGAIGLATHADMQITQVATTQLSPINVQDFTWGLLPAEDEITRRPHPHKAFRYSQTAAQLTFTAQAVQPDIRVTSEQTLSLADDRVLVSIKLSTDIRRAGTFKLSFTLPDNYDIETISSPVLSQWTEYKENDQRIVNLHLNGKTLGKHDWYVTLAGPGIKDTKLWQAPRLRMREAAKQVDQIVAIPETGLRLNVQQQRGLSLIVPKTIGVHHERALAFRTLQEEWGLTLAIEMVEPWIQTQMIHDVLFRQGMMETTANIHYSIQNTGIKTLQIALPANAIGVNIQGPSIVNVLPHNSEQTKIANKTLWVVQLERRIIGNYQLKVSYREIPAEETSARVESIEIMDTQLHRGYLTISSRGRTQATVATPLPPSVQSAEWQNVPHHLRSGLPERESSLCFRLLEREYALQLTLKQHAAAFVLPAQVERVQIHSVFSDSLTLLTHAKITLHAGDKRMLKLKLPPGSQFWFALANTQSSWTWRDDDTIMIPMPGADPNGAPSEVEFLYAQDLSHSERSSIDTTLIGPVFDLPLQAIEWNLYLPQHWEVEDWGGTLEPIITTTPTLFSSLSFDDYQHRERKRVSQRNQQAEKMLQIGNNLLQKGDSKKARYAFESAYNLSKEDMAFNEDARVQLNNLRTQQAVDGLAQRWNQITAHPSQAPASKDPLTQVQNPTTLFQQLAQRLVAQQDAALTIPQTLQATLPQQGKRYAFTRSLQIEPWSDMELQLRANRKAGTGVGYQTFFILAGLIGGVFLLQRKTNG